MSQKGFGDPMASDKANMARLKGQMFTPTPHGFVDIDLSKLGNDIKITDDQGQTVWRQQHNDTAPKVLRVQLEGGFNPTQDFVNVLNDLCGIGGAEDVLLVLNRQSRLKRIADAIL
jgi:hypothetical protein